MRVLIASMRGLKPSISKTLKSAGVKPGNAMPGLLRGTSCPGRGEDRPTDALEVEAREVGGGQPGASTSTISLRDGLEGSAVVNGGLDHEDLVIERIEPDEPYHLGIQRLPAVGDQDDLDVVDVEHRGGAEAAVQAARHRPLVHEAAVGERAHHARHAQRRPVPAVDLAAYLQGHGLAHSRLDAFRDGARIPQAGHHRRARAHAHELAQDLRAVTRPRRLPCCRPCRRARWAGRPRRAPWPPPRARGARCG